MAEYQLTATDDAVVRTADEAWIPRDESNFDWLAYQAWIADGGVPDPLSPEVNANLDAKPAKTTAQILGV